MDGPLGCSAKIITDSKLKIIHVFDKFTLYRKSLQKMRPLNIVQSGQNFAHKLLFPCVTGVALQSHAFPTFSFLGHTTAQVFYHHRLHAHCATLAARISADSCTGLSIVSFVTSAAQCPFWEHVRCSVLL